MRRVALIKKYIDDKIATAGPSTRTIIHVNKSATVENIGGANGTTQVIGWDNELRKDTGFTHNNAVNNTRIQVDADGRYSIKASVSATQGGAGRTTIMMYFIVNNTTDYMRCMSRNYSRGSGYGDLSNNINTEIDLSNGDYIEIKTQVDDTDGVYTLNTIVAQCECIVERIE